jgi:tripartite ATP-independent transporter DctP family solute receptor
MKKIFALVLVLSMFVFTAAPAGAAITFRLAEIHSADYPTTLGNLEFARLVEERTNGRIKIEVFPGGQLGDETAVIQELIIGTIDFGRVSISPVAQFSPGLNALMLPYMYRDTEHMFAVLNGPIGTNLLNAVEDAGLVGLTWYDAGARHFFANRPLTKAADLVGLKIRMQDNRLMIALSTALGASALSMPMGDIYGALQTGVIDGAENNVPSYASWGFYEVAPHFILNGHSRVPEILMGSKAVMDRLSPADVAIIKQAALDSQAHQKQKWLDYEEASIAKIKQNPNVVITEIGAAEWQVFADALADVIAEFGKGYEDIIEQIKNTK